MRKQGEKKIKKDYGNGELKRGKKGKAKKISSRVFMGYVHPHGEHWIL